MENKSPDTIAVFDFDGTLTTKDTLFDFAKFCFGTPRLILGLFALAPILIAFKLKIVPNTLAKQEMLTHFFAHKTSSFFLAKCEAYKERIDKIVRQEALEKIRSHQSEGHRVIIISASIVDWILPWARSVGINEVYATKLEVKDGVLTGKLGNNNCHGQEKVNRLWDVYPDRELYKLYMYGDSSGDKEMLAIADYPFYRKF